MNRGKFKGEFINELMFFSGVAQRDIKKEFTMEQVEDELVKFASSFYGARIGFDEYAIKKGYFIATYAYQIINGNINERELNGLCDEIEEEEKISGLNH